MRSYVELCYRKWLCEKIIFEGWSTIKAAKVLQRDPELVKADFDKFMLEEKISE